MKNKLFILAVISTIFISACTSPTPAPVTIIPPTFENPAVPTAEVTSVIPTVPTSAAISSSGFIQFPYLTADAGNFQLAPGELITMTWTEPPAGAQRYLVILHPLDESPDIILGEDVNSADGVSIQWVVAPNISGMVEGIAYYADGSIVHDTGVSGVVNSLQ